jgi:hypothetical protein
MRLVTAVTTLIQLKRPNYFRPTKPLSEIELLSARQQYRQRLVRVSRVGLAVDRRFLVYPDDRTFSVPVGSQGGQEQPLAHILQAKFLSSGSSAAECPRFDVDQIRLSQ